MFGGSSEGKNTAMRYLARTAMVVGALFLVTVLLAAMPGHNAPAVEGVTVPARPASYESSSASEEAPGVDHSQVDRRDDQAGEGAAKAKAHSKASSSR